MGKTNKQVMVKAERKDNRSRVATLRKHTVTKGSVLSGQGSARVRRAPVCVFEVDHGVLCRCCCQHIHPSMKCVVPNAVADVARSPPERRGR